jgi:hypothetical protein
VWLIPKSQNIFLDVFFRFVLFILIYGAGVLYFKISDDISSLFRIALQRISNFAKTK